MKFPQHFEEGLDLRLPPLRAHSVVQDQAVGRYENAEVRDDLIGAAYAAKNYMKWIGQPLSHQQSIGRA